MIKWSVCGEMENLAGEREVVYSVSPSPQKGHSKVSRKRVLEARDNRLRGHFRMRGDGLRGHF